MPDYSAFTYTSPLQLRERDIDFSELKSSVLPRLITLANVTAPTRATIARLAEELARATDTPTTMLGQVFVESDAGSWFCQLQVCHVVRDQLGEWEREFIRDLRTRSDAGNRLSPKQSAKLDKIYTEVAEPIKFLRLAYEPAAVCDETTEPKENGRLLNTTPR